MTTLPCDSMQNNTSNATNNGGEAIKLLELSSSDSLDSPNFSHFQAPKPKRKVRFKKAFRSSSSKPKTTAVHSNRLCSCRCSDAAKLLATFMLSALFVALGWYVINLSTRIEELQKQFSDIETGNRNTPEELHVIHSKLKDLDSNVTALLTEIKKNIVDIENVTAEIKQLKEITSSLQDSIAAAPTITNLPKDVKSLSEQVVAFGSKITALESSTKELKDSQASIQSTTQTLTDELDSVKNTMHELSNATKAGMNDSQLKSQPSPIARDLSIQTAVQETKQRVSYLQQELFELTTSVEKMNSSFASEIATFANLPAKIETMNSTLTWTIEDQNVKMLSLENYVYKNITMHLDQVDNNCCNDFVLPHVHLNMSEVLELVNKTVTDAIVHIVYTDLHLSDPHEVYKNTSLVSDTHNNLLLMAGLLKQFGNVPDQGLMTETNATHIVSQLLNSSFHEAMAERDGRIKILEDKLKQMNLLVPHGDENKNVMVNNLKGDRSHANGVATAKPEGSP